MNSEVFRCNEMALVTYLKMMGHQVQDVVWDPPNESVFWTFFDLPSLRQAVEQFNQGLALVEPKEYNRLFKGSKREMYSVADRH